MNNDSLCCLTCKSSFSEAAENEGEYDKLFCQTRNKYVQDEDVCELYAY